MIEHLHGEEAYEKNIEMRPTSFETEGALAQLARYWVKEYGGGEGLNFNADQEHRLATDIQAGLSAERISEESDDIEAAILNAIQIGSIAQSVLDTEEGIPKERKAILEQQIQEADVAKQLISSGASARHTASSFIRKGKKAQSALVENNLRFAYFYARESVGIDHEGSLKRMRENGAVYAKAHPDATGLSGGRAYSEGKSGYSGTYRPLKSHKSIYANLEDRQSAATIGLMNAAKRFKTTKPVDGQGRAKFISYAAWSIQSEIQRLAENEEHNGIRLPNSQHEIINSHFGAIPSIIPNEKMSEKVKELLTASEYEQFPDILQANFEGSYDDLNDPFGEDDIAGRFDEIYADPNQDTSTIVERRMSRRIVESILEGLSEREMGIIDARFGLGFADGVEYNNPKTFKEIGDTYGVTIERIRQIESKALAKIRHPSRSMLLRDFVSLDNGDGLPSDFVSRGDQVKLPLGAATYNGPQTHEIPVSELREPFTAEQLHQREEKQAWQLDQRESWDTPVRTFSEKPSSVVEVELFQFIDKVIVNADAYHFQKSFAESVKSPYPTGLIRRIDAYCEGKTLNHGQIASIWTHFMSSSYPRIKSELSSDFSGDRVGQFFSKLIETHLRSVESNAVLLTLQIPESASGEIGYLASGLSYGRIKIIGNTGKYTGALNKGFADVKIRGNVGDYAGSMMSGEAQLGISGNAGHHLGENAKEHAYIEAASAVSIGDSGDNNLHVHIRY